MSRAPLPSNLSRLITLAMIVLVVAILYFANSILVPLALAILFTFLLSPVVTRLERWKIPRAPAVIGVVLLCCMLLLFIIWIVGGQLANLADNLDHYRGNIEGKITAFSPGHGTWLKLTRVADELQEKLEKPATQATTQPTTLPASVTKTAASDALIPAPGAAPLPVSVVENKTAPLAMMQRYLGVALGPLAMAGLVTIFVIFILLRREDLRDRIIKLVAHGSLTITTQALDDAAERISKYLLMQSIVNICFGLCMGIGFRLIGIPNAFLWGLLCTILRFIPYIGTWIAACFPLSLALAVFPDNHHFVYTAIFYVVVELIVANFIEPSLYGSSTGMSEVAVLLAAVFWAWLWGPIGLLLSTPLTTILVVIGKHFPQMSFLDTLLSDTPALDPYMRYYQRLLALDENESGKLVEEYLEKMSLEDVYDTVVIPALVLAEEDRRQGQLDDQRQKFIIIAVSAHILRLNVRRMALEEAVQGKETELKEVVEGIPLPTSDKNPTHAEKKYHPTPITGRPEIHVLCLPAHSDADALVANILAQCLEIRGFSASFVDAAMLAGEMVQRVAAETTQIVAISALPPRAVRSSRYICKRLHAVSEDLPIAVGLWNTHVELRLARRRIAPEPSVHVAKSLCGLINVIDQMAKSMLHQAN
jgi:predicted PurR-regulated permease PerM